MKSKIESESELNFIKPAVYKIKVQGHLEDSWSKKFGGMQINSELSKEKSIITVLIGQINDQSALSGILNTLYELHLTIISVRMLRDENS